MARHVRAASPEITAEPQIGEQLTREWDSVQEDLRSEIGDAAFGSWIRPLTLVGVDDTVLRFAVPSRSLRDWVTIHYADRIRDLWARINPSFSAIEIEIGKGLQNGAAIEVAPIEVAPKAKPQSRPTGPTGSDSAPLGFDAISSGALDQRFTFENFVVGSPNQLAYAAAHRVSESDKVPFNPLFLYGGVGLGKTHLMHAIAWRLRERRPDKRVMYVSAEKFMYQFVRAVQYKDTVSFKEQFRSVDVLMIDDIQFIGGKESTQEEFFHTFNALVDQNRQVIVSADKSPSDLDGMEERLKSRLGWGLVADIHPTTYELRLGILRSKAERLEIAVPDQVLEFLAHRFTSNVRLLEGALNRLVAHAELMGCPITIDMPEQALADMLRSTDRRPGIEEIQRRVAAHYGQPISIMFSKSRARKVARPRQLAMYLCKQLTERSLPEIGRNFGNRDHTTVMHAVKRIDELKETDEILAQDFELLRRTLTS